MNFDDIYLRIRHLLGRGRGVVQDDTGVVQLMQITPSSIETIDGVPRLAEYGFQSAPPDGCDVALMSFSGDRQYSVVVATNHQQFRVTGLKKGEVCVSDNQGQQIYLKNGGGIWITDKAGSTLKMNGDGTATITANLKIVGTLEVTQNITADEDVLVSALSVKNHVHPGVQSGSSLTGTMES